MHVNGKHHSVSLSTVALEAEGDITVMRYVESCAFVDESDATDNRRIGTEHMFGRIEALITT